MTSCRWMGRTVRAARRGGRRRRSPYVDDTADRTFSFTVADRGSVAGSWRLQRQKLSENTTAAAAPFFFGFFPHVIADHVSFPQGAIGYGRPLHS
jgi:hypothetical protein